MTTELLLITGLKVADPTAITALATLRTRLGFEEILAGLSREELFLFEMEGGEEGARAAVAGLVRDTNLFFNPNKHRHRLSTDIDGIRRVLPTERNGENLAHNRHRAVKARDSVWPDNSWLANVVSSRYHHPGGVENFSNQVVGLRGRRCYADALQHRHDDLERVAIVDRCPRGQPDMVCSGR